MFGFRLFYNASTRFTGKANSYYMQYDITSTFPLWRIRFKTQSTSHTWYSHVDL